MKTVVVGGAVATAVAVIALAIFLQTDQPAQIQVSKGFLNSLLKMNETERLLMFTMLTPEQESVIKPQEEYCHSLAIDNNHTAISQSRACSAEVEEQRRQFMMDNLQERLAVADQTMALSGRNYTQYQTDYINQIYRDCLWDEASYHYYITDKTVEICRNEIQTWIREGKVSNGIEDQMIQIIP